MAIIPGVKPRYVRRLEALAKGEGGAKDWSVYILRCGDGTYYTGIAKDLASRLKAHNSGKGAAYTRTRRPVELLHHEPGLSRSEALVREAEIKRLPRREKGELAFRRG